MDRLLFLYQASSGNYEGSSLYVPFPESAACGPRIEQCGYTYEARVPGAAAVNALGFKSNSLVPSVDAASNSSQARMPGAAAVNALGFNSSSTFSRSTDAKMNSWILPQQSTEEHQGEAATQAEQAISEGVAHVNLHATAAAAATRLVADSVVERYIEEEDSGGPISGDPASQQARDYLRR